MTDQCKPCPVCGRQPKWYASQVRNAESLECPWDEGCPEGKSFNFITGDLPVPEAIAAWNFAVDAWGQK